MSGLCINRPIIGRLLDADRPLPYRCTSSVLVCLSVCWQMLYACGNFAGKLFNLWRPLLPYGFSYKASCSRPGYAVICDFWHL